MGTPSLQPFLKSYWLTPVQMTGQLSQSMQIWRARDSINAMPTTITSESSTSPVEFVMATVCKICAEAALDESDCGHCADLPVRSKLDSWYFRSTRKADSRASVPFFPDVHEQLVKTWSAPQSARVHSNTQGTFSHVDGAEAHGYVRSPPVEEIVAAHLCPAAAKTLGSDISLPSKPCRTTGHLANKAYASDGEAASVLHAMTVLQVFQAKLLQAAELSLLRLRRICARRWTSRWWRRSERPRPWVRPWVLWSFFRGTSG